MGRPWLISATRRWESLGYGSGSQFVGMVNSTRADGSEKVVSQSWGFELGNMVMGRVAIPSPRVMLLLNVKLGTVKPVERTIAKLLVRKGDA